MRDIVPGRCERLDAAPFVEQLTGSCVDALTSRPHGLLDRGSRALEGKSAAVRVFTLGLEDRETV